MMKRNSMKVDNLSLFVARILNGLVILLLLITLGDLTGYKGLEGFFISESLNLLILVWFIVFITMNPVPEFEIQEEGKLYNFFLEKFKSSDDWINRNHAWRRHKTLYMTFVLTVISGVCYVFLGEGLFPYLWLGFFVPFVYGDAVRLYRYNIVQQKFKSICGEISQIENNRAEFDKNLPFRINVVTSKNEVRKCRSIADISNLPDGLLEYVVVGFDKDTNTMHFGHGNEDMTSKKTLYHELSDVDINGDRTPSGDMLINILYDYREKVISLEKSLEENIDELYSFV